MLGAMEYALGAEEYARKNGFLQGTDPRAKLVGLMALIVATATARKLAAIGMIFVIALALAALSRIPMRTLAIRAWLGALLFTGLIALPALFITPGDEAFSLPLIGLPITKTGLKSASFLIARTETAVTLSLLLVLCTPWAHVLKSLRALHVPAILVVILGMTYRYIFLLMQTAREMLESRRSRNVGKLGAGDSRRFATATVGALLSRSMDLSGEVYLAMRSRGFHGAVDILDDFRMRPRDWLTSILLVGCAVAASIIGR
jgi:cobalt ECF transporter T component CbiQ